MNTLIKLIKKYYHGIPLCIYAFIYITWFRYLEETVTQYRIIHIPLDDHIPFCEIFIIPYLLWFVYVAAVVGFLLLRNKTDYYKSCVFLFTGMTLFLIISTLWPNGHHLRPYVMPRDNVFTDMILRLYQTDTATNLWPSIHVYNSIGAHLAVSKCAELKKYKFIQYGSLFLSISIILSTVLIKQHSAFDVFTAFILAGIMYILVYGKEAKLFTRIRKYRNDRRPQTIM